LRCCCLAFTDFADGFGGARSASDFSDFFESLFGGRGSARSSADLRMPAQDIEAEISLTLEEADVSTPVEAIW
jgi:curved DNA-binding protein